MSETVLGQFREKSQFAPALTTFHGPFGILRYSSYNFFVKRFLPQAQLLSRIIWVIEFLAEGKKRLKVQCNLDL